MTHMQCGNATSYIIYMAQQVSRTPCMLLVLVWPACTGHRRGPAPGDMDHPPSFMDAIGRDGRSAIIIKS